MSGHHDEHLGRGGAGAIGCERGAIVTTYEDDYLDVFPDFRTDSRNVIHSVTTSEIRVDIGDGNYGVSTAQVVRLARRALAAEKDPVCLFVVGGTL